MYKKRLILFILIILFVPSFFNQTFGQTAGDSTSISKSISISTIFSSNSVGTSYAINFSFSKKKNIFSLGTVIGHPLYFIKGYLTYRVENPKKWKYTLKGINFNICHKFYTKKEKINFFIDYDLLYFYYQDKGGAINYTYQVNGQYPTVDFNAKRHVFENFISCNININITKRFFIYHQLGIGFSSLFNKQTYSNNQMYNTFDNMHYSDLFNFSMLFKFGLGFNLSKNKKNYLS